ncbi:hypothetical protein CMU59_10970 [Elizabethkingia anophelis]|uniref:hypothetical protein n=1 Tax=Elizabethkingia anophelis TaxID=1117645 RepID=UPI002011062B|nr:hypothetical protein [Elizabethkingia anophelis]MCL1689066.1 hypothetical protein [Elizabethkingia anophelis]MDV3574231.1 hypothetical protein [Elizabethkingia anophelis]MDV3600947.1 hypothetical protein [Elizabethkingia anophelis]MDV3606687.1 hypothetical protein [Elizabethkingia anophelis]MDV3639162.1 hypothetical protein [Elizabethkingia anophelis]
MNKKEDQEIPNTIKELLKDFSLNTKERLRLPIFQYYIITLILYNWDFLLYLLIDSNQILKKILFIKENFYSSERVLIPLFIAIVYSLLFPIIQFYIVKIQKGLNKQRINWNYETQIENANHRKSIQNILTGIKEKEDFEKQLEFEKNRNVNLQNEIQILRDEIIQLQKNYNDSSTESNNYKQEYYSLLSNFRFYLKHNNDINSKIKETFVEEQYFKYFNILIEIFNYVEISNNIDVSENFNEKLYKYLLYGNKEFIFSNNNLINERIIAHISNILMKYNLINNNDNSTNEYNNLLIFLKELNNIEQ